jgi:tRNA A-37 threonylcarbamoyl transferase component Bud32
VTAATQVGAYRVLHQIGEGGMGSVWVAEHAMLGRRAAIKLLHPQYNARPDIVTRFFNEARAATAISDPGIVQIFDFGYHEGSAYIAMEMLDGEPLDKRLWRLGRFPVGDALRIMRQIASSVGVAHRAGIVHRDLKPENVYLVRDPEVAGGERAKILDFGIAKLTNDPSVQKTQASAVMGTPTYMSPEQCRGAGQVDARSDVYALGCMLFVLLTGAPPFAAEGMGEIIAMHLRETPPAPSQRAPNIPPQVDAVVAQCLAKDPAHRFNSGTELAAALGLIESTVTNVPVSAGSVASARPAMPVATTLGAAAGMTSTPPVTAKRPRGALIIGAGAAVAVGIVITAVVASSSDGPAKPAAAPSVPEHVNAPATTAPPPTTPSAPAGNVPTKPATPSAPAETTPTKYDPMVELAGSMKTVVEQFVAWAKLHAGAACPTIADLAVTAVDPWKHAFAITCTDQPANQMIGVVSAGPDGTPGTADDVASWTLGRDVTDPVHGTRWVAAPKIIKKQPTRPVHHDDDDIPKNR